jgi:hypothetical protein
MTGARDILLGEADRCREAALKTTSPEIRVGLLELAQKYIELARRVREGDHGRCQLWTEATNKLSVLTCLFRNSPIARMLPSITEKWHCPGRRWLRVR